MSGSGEGGGGVGGGGEGGGGVGGGGKGGGGVSGGGDGGAEGGGGDVGGGAGEGGFAGGIGGAVVSVLPRVVVEVSSKSESSECNQLALSCGMKMGSWTMRS